MRDKVNIDTNILFYALNRESPKSEKAKNILFSARKVDSSITLRALSECYALALKRNSKRKKKARIFVESLNHDTQFNIISSGKKELDRALEEDKNFWDRMIEETALEHGYQVIYTEKTDDFNEIDAINPF